MSCQQASRFITTNNNSSSNIIINNRSNTNSTNPNCKNLNNNKQSNNTLKGNLIARRVIQQEDPYVFTESVPTTPPILFNTQKTRTRLSDLTSTCAGNLQQQKSPLTEANGKITANLNQTKTQASFLSSNTTISTINSCSLSASKNNVNQSLTAATTTATTITNNHSNSKKQANVCIVRPQLQTQQSHHHHHHQNYVNSSITIYEGGLKSVSPPPLYTPPTPSLWQTPLLLETTTPTNAKVANVMAVKPPTAVTSQNVPTMGCVTPTIQAVGGTTTTTTMNSSLTTTAMAKVAPIIVHTPSALPPPLSLASTPNQCLPPSKFHNHTLAQHLQKVECLKKSIKPTETDNVFCNDKDNTITSPSKPSSPPAALSKAVSLNALNNLANTDKHSENEDLNEIPVNVIFRMAVVPQANEEFSNNEQNLKTHTEIDTKPQQPTQTTKKTPPSSPNTTQFETNVSKNSSIPASRTTVIKQFIKQQQPQQQQQHQQIDTSSITQQQFLATKTTNNLALNSQSHRMPNEADKSTSKTSTIWENSMKIDADTKGKTLTHISNKARKLNSSPSTNDNLDLSYSWQIGCSTTKGAVAVVKMSQHYVDLDTCHLATVTGLPYCLQKCWLNPYDMIKSTSDILLRKKSLTNRSLAREERIALYRHQLRRQAMQLLSIRSLQKLPLKVAKRRLLCVDRLLKKYQQIEENKKELPANVKRCCVNGCDAYTLEMSSHCQQHIVCNAAQHVFLPCTAKFADNTQCRVPVFDITHDLPLCPEHARKRDAYNRLLYEQRPRKITTNPLFLDGTITLTPKLLATNSNAELLPSAVVIKTQNIQQNKQKQQQQQHLLQQFSANNNSNSNKRPALVNQQARKRKMTVGLTANPVGRPQKRVKKTVEKSVGSLTTTTIAKQMPRLTSSCLKRKSSTTSLESIASNSQHSTTSSTSQYQHQYQRQQQQQQNTYGVMPTAISSSSSGSISVKSLAPPALAPLSGAGLVGHGLPQHLFSFGHDNNQHSRNTPNKNQHHQHQLQHPIQHPINLNDKHSSFSVSTASVTNASTPTELKEFISQLSFNSQKQNPQVDTCAADVNLLNTNSNSNFTSSGMGSTTSLPTADDFLTQDMLSICENSSASSADTGLGGLSDPELMLGGPDDDIPLGDTHLLEEHDLENVLNSLPEDAFKELFTTVHQDESDEIERAIELADKHLKTLQQTIGTELGDFLDFSDDMLMDNGDLCNGSSANNILDTSALFIGGGTVGSASVAVSAANGTQGGGADIRGLVQT